MALNGLCSINIELTDRCCKECWICGRREREKIHPELIANYGDIEFSLLEKIAKQVPSGIVIQLHNNGEGFLYRRFGEAIRLFNNRGCITNIVTNGKLLLNKFDEFVDVLDTMSISIFENDVEQEEQYKIIKEFLQLKGDRKPYTTLRLIGNINEERYKIFKCLIVKRTLHLPKGSVEYRREPTIPEIGICWDFLTRLAINKKGDVSVCVRYDPEGELILGNLRDNTLDSLWNSDKRLRMKAMHVLGKRHEIPYCGDKCHYWGVPTAS